MRCSLAALLVCTVFATAGVGRVAMTQSLPADGKKVFQATCSSQYCHGPSGAGGLGPRLIDHPMPPDLISATIRDGRSGTSMPPFKNALDPAEINAVTAYVLSLSPSAAPPSPDEDAEPSALPVAVGRGKGTPAQGANVFFDATRLSSCRTCHTYHGRGGPLGVDLATLHETPEQVLASITRPKLASRDFPVVAITTVSGETLTGIRGKETPDTLQVFDVTIPPVRRSLQKTQIASVSVSERGVFDHTKLGLTHQQLLDVAALVGSRP
jgi:mono/diheme cytochrome c family protein